LSEPAPLPDGDDPFEILGIPETNDAKEIKRAYVRRIKVYRPETHPVEFARIRAAFQNAKSGLAAAPAPSAGIEWSETDRRTALLAKAWGHARDGDEAAARATFAELRSEDPYWAPGRAHGFLLAEALGASTEEALDDLLEGLRRNAPIAVWAYALLDLQELAEHSVRPEFSWEHLREQPDRDSAILLYRYRIQTELVRGELDEILREIDAPEFVDDAARDPRLADIARQVMAVLAWDDPEAAERLFVSFPSHESADGADWIPEDLHAQATLLSGDWKAWSSRFPDLGALGRFIRVSLLADPPRLVRLAEELHVDLLSQPDRHAEALDVMESRHPQLLQWTIGCLQEYRRPRDEEERALDAREASRIWQVIHAADARLSADWVHRGLRTVLGLLVVGALLSFFAVGWWGFAVLGGALVAALVVINSGDGWVYRHRLRGPLMRAVLETPVLPSTMVEWMEARSDQLERIDMFTGEIGSDHALEALALLRSLGERPA